MEAVDELESILEDLSAAADATYIHTHKFKLLVEQFRQFFESFRGRARNSPLSPLESDALSQIGKISIEIHEACDTFRQKRWFRPTVRQPSWSMAGEICRLCTKLHQSAGVLDAQASEFFNASPDVWANPHLEDLRFIKDSFQQILNHPDVDGSTKETARLRYNSVEEILGAYGGDIASQPEISIFSPLRFTFLKWRRNHADFVKESIIGNGGFAKVYRGTLLEDGRRRPVAIKELNTHEMTPRQAIDFHREIDILTSIKHPTLVEFLGATETPPFCLVLELMENGCLFDELHQHHRLTPTQKTKAAYDVARGMRHLHRNAVIHRDLKSLNVLLDSRGVAKICDFGCARRDDAMMMMTRDVGTCRWMAPECIMGSRYTAKVDVYSYGIVLWELLTGSIPFSAFEDAAVIARVMQLDSRPPIPAQTPEPLRALITSCWCREAAARKDFDEIVSQFRTGDILFVGTDRAEFMEYVAQTTEKYDAPQVEPDGDRRLTELVAKLKGGTLVEGEISDLIGCLVASRKGNLCLDTLKELIASEKLKEATISVLKQFPTGRLSLAPLVPKAHAEEIEREFGIACVRHGAADLVCVHPMDSEVRTIAFEAVARRGPRHDFWTAVADHCIRYTQDTNESLACAAMRCLTALGNDGFMRVYPERFTSIPVESWSVAGLHCACLLSMGLSRIGRAVPSAFLEKVIMRASNDEVAILTLVVACTTSPEEVLALVDKYPEQVGVRDCVRMLMAVPPSKSDETRAAVEATLVKLKIAEPGSEFAEHAEIIRGAWKQAGKA
jgi:serine/threonine protein kinase